MILNVNEFINLTHFQVSDWESLVEYLNDDEVYNNTISIPRPYTQETAFNYLKMVESTWLETGIQSQFAIRLANNNLIGSIGVLNNYGAKSHKNEIGYWIASPFRGKGIMTAVVSYFTKYLMHDLGLKRIEASVMLHNIASEKVLLNAGFEYECLSRNFAFKDGKLLDAKKFVIISD